MRKFRGILTATTAVLVLALAGCAGATPDADRNANKDAPNSLAELAPDFEASIAGTLAKNQIPGAVVLITQAGEPQWSYVYNDETLSAEPVDFDQIFAYRSVTKSFTVTALLQLVDSGDVELDDPIGDYVDGVPNGDRITLRDLAQMRSGLANYSAMPELGELLMSNPAATMTDTTLIASALAAPIEFEPESQFMYSNTNTVLLGQVIEQVTGQSWSEAVRVNVSSVLGLDSVTYPDAAHMPPETAMPYQVTDGEVEALPTFSPTLFSAAGGLFGTVTDLAAWADELATGSLLTAETQQARLDSLRPTTSDPLSPEYDEYGLGIGKIGDYVGHTGNGLGFQALAMHNPHTNVSVAILFNSTQEDGDLPAHLFQALIPILDSAR